MAQARVTEYFTRRKKSVVGEAKPAARYGRLENSPSAISASENADLCSSAVRDEFVRLIDDVVGLSDGAFVGNKSSPRTPKRTSDGRAVSTDASPAKKRQVEAAREVKETVPEKATKKKSRKKLALADPPPVNGAPSSAS